MKWSWHQSREIELPDYVRVVHADYRVQRVGPELLYGEDRYGDCDHTRHVIRVVTGGISPQAIVETLWHEVLHASCHVIAFDKDDEESLVSRLAPVQLAVLRDNPELTELLNKYCSGDI